MSLTHNATRTLAASLTTAALAAPLAIADDLPDTLARGVPTPVAPVTRPRTRDAPIVVEVTSERGFDWSSAGIGAGGGIALVLIALAGAATVTGKSRAPPH